ncbi:hypothetical protein D3C80_1586900 [compost metagenome]
MRLPEKSAPLAAMNSSYLASISEPEAVSINRSVAARVISASRPLILAVPALLVTVHRHSRISCWDCRSV